MKKNFLFILITHIFFTASALSQEASLVKTMEWGSGEYRHAVILNDYIYVASTSNQLDIINPNEQGASSFKGQIDLDSIIGAGISSIGVFNEHLVVVRRERLDIYSVSGLDELNLKYSIEIKGARGTDPLFISDAIYFIDRDETIFIIKENNGGFKIDSVIPGNENTEIQKAKLVKDGHFLYAMTASYIDNSYTTHLFKYDLSSSVLEYEENINGLDYISDSVYIGLGRFVVTGSNFMKTVIISNEKSMILNNFSDQNINRNFKLSYKDTTLYAYTGYGEIYSFEIDENNIVTAKPVQKLNNYFKSYNHIFDVLTLDDEIYLLTQNEGILRLNSGLNVTGLYNQSGFMGKAAYHDGLLFLPRGSRIDILDPTSETLLVKKLPTLAEKISIVKGNFLITDNINFILSNNKILDSLDLIKLSEIIMSGSVQHSLQTENSLYNIVYDNGHVLERYNIESPYSLYLTPEKLILDNLGNNVCVEDIGGINNNIVIVDPCSNALHIISIPDGQPMLYEKRIPLTERFLDVSISNNLIYFTKQNKLSVERLTESLLLEEASAQEVIWDPAYSANAKVAVFENNLIVTSANKLYLFNIKNPIVPTLISTTDTKLLELINLEWNSFENKFFATNQNQGKLRVFEINKSPATVNSDITIEEDSDLAINKLFSDPEGDEFSISLISEASHGQFNNETNLYTPNSNYFGEDTLTVKVEDIHGNFVEQEINMTISPVDDAPIAENLSVNVTHNGSANGSLASADIDADILTYSIVDNVAQGTLALSADGGYSYTPNNDYTGTDSFVFNVTDGRSESQGTITFTVAKASVVTTPNPKNESSGGGSINFNLLVLLCLSLASRFLTLKVNN